MGKIYMTACMKGGCAKTVTTYNLAYSLKELGKKVLCVDFDSQANPSTCFGVEDVTAVTVMIGYLMMLRLMMKNFLEQRNIFRAEMVWILFHPLWCCQQWMQSLELKWEQRRCFRASWNSSEIDMMRLSLILHRLWVL